MLITSPLESLGNIHLPGTSRVDDLTLNEKGFKQNGLQNFYKYLRKFC